MVHGSRHHHQEIMTVLLILLLLLSTLSQAKCCLSSNKSKRINVETDLTSVTNKELSRDLD